MVAEPPRPTPLHLLDPRERPPFTPMVVEQIRGSIAALKTATEDLPEGQRLLTDHFYRELFAIAPETRGMFARDITPQSDRLLRALLAAADGLEAPDKVERKLRLWGVVHRRQHEVDDSYYVYVGQALIRTIRAFLPEASSVLYSCWAAVYAWLAAVMIAGAAEADQLRDDPLFSPSPTTAPISLDNERGEREARSRSVIPLGPRGYRARRHG